MRHRASIVAPRLAVCLLTATLLGASCDSIDPDAEEVTAVVANCTVEEIDASSGIETCMITSSDPRLNGDWQFDYVTRKDDNQMVLSGELVIVTVDGGWEGSAERVIHDQGPWKGGASLQGSGGFEGYELDLGGEENSIGDEYPMTGAVTQP